MRKSIAVVFLVAFGVTTIPTAAQASIVDDPKVSWSDRTCHGGTLKVTGRGTEPTKITVDVPWAHNSVVATFWIKPYQTRRVKVGCGDEFNVYSSSAGVDFRVKVKKRHGR